MNAAVEPTRLYTVLDRTNLRSKDPVLYQLLYNLIGNLANLVPTVSNLVISTSGSGSGSSTETSTVNNVIMYGDEISIQENYMTGGSGLGSFRDTYGSPITNGDPVTPELIFDSFGDVVMATGIPT